MDCRLLGHGSENPERGMGGNPNKDLERFHRQVTLEWPCLFFGYLFGKSYLWLLSIF